MNGSGIVGVAALHSPAVSPRSRHVHRAEAAQRPAHRRARIHREPGFVHTLFRPRRRDPPARAVCRGPLLLLERGTLDARGPLHDRFRRNLRGPGLHQRGLLHSGRHSARTRTQWTQHGREGENHSLLPARRRPPVDDRPDSAAGPGSRSGNQSGRHHPHHHRPRHRPESELDQSHPRPGRTDRQVR